VHYFSGAFIEKETVARLNTIGRVGMNVFTSKDLFDKVKIRKNGLRLC
jgi:hypothetical protein